MNNQFKSEPIANLTKKWLRDTLTSHKIDYLKQYPGQFGRLWSDLDAFINFVCPPEPQDEITTLKARVAELEAAAHVQSIASNDRRNFTEEFFYAVQNGLFNAGMQCDKRATNIVCKTLYTEARVRITEHGQVRDIPNPHLGGNNISGIAFTIAQMHGK